MSENLFDDLRNAHESAVWCCECVQVLASKKPPAGQIVSVSRVEAYSFQTAAIALEQSIPPAARAVEPLADELATARREIVPGVAEACGLVADSYHQLAVDLAREVLARLRRAAESKGAKFHEIYPKESGNMEVGHVGWDAEVMRQIDLQAQYAAVGVDEAGLARLAGLVREESRIAVGNRQRLGPHWDPMMESRDKWLYEKAMAGEALKRIQRDLKEACQRQNWQPIGTISGLRKAISSYARRHGLPEPPKRKSGRPPSQSDHPKM